MALDFTILNNNAPLDMSHPLAIPADGFSKVTLVLQVPTPVAAGAGNYTISTSCIFKITPVQGSVDATSGQAQIIVGPSPFGVKGDVTVTVQAGAHKQKQTFDVRFV